MHRKSRLGLIKTAVIGASGYVGRHLFASYRSHFPDCVGTSFSNPAPELMYFDIRKPDLQVLNLEETGHQAVIVASACPLIQRCEEEKEATYAVNVSGTLELLRQISETSLTAIFLSSDYVFSGDFGPHEDTELPRPSTEYGRHKAIIEAELPRLTDNYLILRLSKIVGLKKGDDTLLDQMARCMAAGTEVKAAADQLFCPTYVGDLVNAIMEIQARALRGIMNVANNEIWSRYEAARTLSEMMNVEDALVRKISLYDIPSMRGRPLNTSMSCIRLANETDANFQPLRWCIERVAKNWREP